MPNWGDARGARLGRGATAERMKAGDRVRLISLRDKDKLAYYYSEPPTRIGDTGKLIREEAEGVFVCGFLNYVLIVNDSMVQVIHAD